VLKDYTTICGSAPSEFLTALALRNRQVFLERNLAIVRRNLPLLGGFSPACCPRRVGTPDGQPDRVRSRYRGRRPRLLLRQAR
jgi:hypothetical protein